MSNEGKIYEAYQAGSESRNKCVLILASSIKLAIKAVSFFGRKNHGVIPISEALPNVKNMNFMKLKENSTIKNILKTMGLEIGNNNIDNIRYGSILILTEKSLYSAQTIGLIINLFHTYWSHLLQNDYFISSLEVDVDEPIIIDNIVEYKWSNVCMDNGVNICDGAIDVAFSSSHKFVEERRELYKNINFNCTKTKIMTYADFIYNEYMNYSYADSIRSIPCIIDGLKPYPRMVLNILLCNSAPQTTIKKICTDLVHDNNMLPISCAKDVIYHMSANYKLFNAVNILTIKGHEKSILYRDNDINSNDTVSLDPLLQRYVYFDRFDRPIHIDKHNPLSKYTPVIHVPIVPIVLFNQCCGIGSGFSTSIPSWHPIDVCENLLRLLNGRKMIPLKPWIKGYESLTEKVSDFRYLVKAEFIIKEKFCIKITKLPIEQTIDRYKEFLNNMISGGKPIIKSYKEKCTNNEVNIKIILNQEITKDNEEQILRKLKLVNIINLNNMHLITPDGHIKKYNTCEEILQDYYEYVIGIYEGICGKSARDQWSYDIHKFMDEYQSLNQD
ncbi:putative DNA topoisomerase 2 isoform X2 [Tupanvirus deep ocean]|uniref:DNA topoisomerase 2 isoform X2 n=2 Tax=Tupanvirus TaxID=2094720 RepID=A0AC62A982_9VIRU|nr:putative DNA topoisomerase 2 isoform X2 [Tupanvirus deep ocean]QKU34310.1 putative DNA topoisomerase 2 isoform X2 [Tupanvirus deep ocean]